jgi:hypothetical protein
LAAPNVPIGHADEDAPDAGLAVVDALGSEVEASVSGDPPETPTAEAVPQLAADAEDAGDDREGLHVVEDVEAVEFDNGDGLVEEPAAVGAEAEDDLEAVGVHGIAPNEPAALESEPLTRADVDAELPEPEAKPDNVEPAAEDDAGTDVLEPSTVVLPRPGRRSRLYVRGGWSTLRVGPGRRAFAHAGPVGATWLGFTPGAGNLRGSGSSRTTGSRRSSLRLRLVTRPARTHRGHPPRSPPRGATASRSYAHWGELKASPADPKRSAGVAFKRSNDGVTLIRPDFT